MGGFVKTISDIGQGIYDAAEPFVGGLLQTVGKLGETAGLLAEPIGEVVLAPLKAEQDVVESLGKTAGVKEVENLGRTSSDILGSPVTKHLAGTAAMIAATYGVAGAIDAASLAEGAAGETTLGGTEETLGGARQLADISQATEEATAEEATLETVPGSRQIADVGAAKEIGAAVKALSDLGTGYDALSSAASLLQKKTEVTDVVETYPTVEKYPDNWSTLTSTEKSAWLVRGNAAAKRWRGTYAGELGSLAGVGDTELAKGLLTGTKQTGQQALLGG